MSWGWGPIDNDHIRPGSLPEKEETPELYSDTTFVAQTLPNKSVTLSTLFNLSISLMLSCDFSFFLHPSDLQRALLFSLPQ